MADVDVDLPQRVTFKCKRPFTVIEYIDINDPALLVPMRSENDKMLCCLCCESGPLTLHASLDRVGYCPGESVIISASAENLTNRVVRGVRAQLIAATTRNARGHTNTARRVVCEMLGEPIAVGATGKWENRSFPIPPVPPSIKTCRIIDHSYYIQVCVVVPNGINLKVHFPVVMGTIPFRQEAQPPDQQVLFIDNRAANIFELLRSIPMSQAAPIVPATTPSFVEATGMTVNIADREDHHTMGNLQYTPLLPFAATGGAMPVSHSSNEGPAWSPVVQPVTQLSNRADEISVTSSAMSQQRQPPPSYGQLLTVQTDQAQYLQGASVESASSPDTMPPFEYVDSLGMNPGSIPLQSLEQDVAELPEEQI